MYLICIILHKTYYSNTYVKNSRIYAKLNLKKILFLIIFMLSLKIKNKLLYKKITSKYNSNNNRYYINKYYNI